MKPTYKARLISLLPLLFIICLPAISQRPRGKEKTIPDDTYGAGGFKTTFSIKNTELILYRDPNKVRRLLENINSFPGKNGTSGTTGSTYFDCYGKESYFSSATIDVKGNQVQGLIQKFSGDGSRLPAITWTMGGGTRLTYTQNLSTKKFDLGGVFPQEVYKPAVTLCPKVDLGFKKQMFEYNLTGNTHYKSSEASSEYVQGKVVIDAYQDYDDYDGDYRVIDKKIYDKHGVVRHENYREFYPDGCVYEEVQYFDCHGKLQYYGYTWYDEDGYEYEIYDEYDKDGEMTAGYYFYDGYNYGEEYTLDPDTGEPMRGWRPDLNEPEDFEPDASDCPDTYAYWNHDFYIGPSVIIEDEGGGDHFSTYGGELSYSWHPCYRSSVIGDMGFNFGKNFDTKYTRITALAGGAYYPVKTATLKNDFSFSVRGLVGLTYLNSKYSFGNFSSTNNDTYFTGCVGLGFDKKLSDQLGVGLKLDYLPGFSKGNTASDFRIGLGLEFK